MTRGTVTQRLRVQMAMVLSIKRVDAAPIAALPVNSANEYRA